jgi:dihydroorotase
VARRALAQGFRPGTISSDLHVYNVNGPVHDLATTLSKFLHLGLSLDEVVHMATAAPGRVLRGAAALGTLAPGAAADVTLLERRDGRFDLEDAVGEKVTARERLVPVGVIRDGVLVSQRH